MVQQNDHHDGGVSNIPGISTFQVDGRVQILQPVSQFLSKLKVYQMSLVPAVCGLETDGPTTGIFAKELIAKSASD